MAKWKCIYCNREQGVTNGDCPDCGATQTTPLDKEAKKEAGADVIEEFHKRDEDSKKVK